LTLQLFQKLGANVAGITSALVEELEKLPRVEGAGAGQIYMSTRLNMWLRAGFFRNEEPA